MDHLHPRSRIVPDRHCHELYRYGQPLAISFVTIGYRREIDKDENGELLGTIIKQPLPNVTVDTAITDEVQAMISEGRRIYAITFAIGHFVAQVIGHDLLAQVQVSTGNAPVQRIWRTSPRFDWPASRAVDDIGGVAALHRASMQQPPASLAGPQNETLLAGRRPVNVHRQAESCTSPKPVSICAATAIQPSAVCLSGRCTNYARK